VVKVISEPYETKDRPKGLHADIGSWKGSELVGVNQAKKFSAPQSLV
jgi:hypothetical protein